jgi:hypothetical protein
MKYGFLENEMLITVCMLLAVMRIYLEVIRFDFAKLPLTAKMPQEYQNKVHRTGLYLSVGYVILFAPQVLLG